MQQAARGALGDMYMQSIATSAKPLSLRRHSCKLSSAVCNLCRTLLWFFRPPHQTPSQHGTSSTRHASSTWQRLIQLALHTGAALTNTACKVLPQPAPQPNLHHNCVKLQRVGSVVSV